MREEVSLKKFLSDMYAGDPTGLVPVEVLLTKCRQSALRGLSRATALLLMLSALVLVGIGWDQISASPWGWRSLALLIMAGIAFPVSWWLGNRYAARRRTTEAVLRQRMMCLICASGMGALFLFVVAVRFELIFVRGSLRSLLPWALVSVPVLSAAIYLGTRLLARWLDPDQLS